MIQNTRIFSVISGFRREVVENLALLGYYAASSGNFYYSPRNNPEERGYCSNIELKFSFTL
jgi:hypothetical protein